MCNYNVDYVALEPERAGGGAERRSCEYCKKRKLIVLIVCKNATVSIYTPRCVTPWGVLIALFILRSYLHTPGGVELGVCK